MTGVHDLGDGRGARTEGRHAADRLDRQSCLRLQRHLGSFFSSLLIDGMGSGEIAPRQVIGTHGEVYRPFAKTVPSEAISTCGNIVHVGGPLPS
jgi:hypothetical protein